MDGISDKANPASRPFVLQGGKYVGFGSAGSAPPRPPQNGGIDQVTTMLSTGWNQLSTAAGACLLACGHRWCSIGT